MSRVRRSTAKKVDYAKVQEFSDAEDIFQDSEEEPAPAAVKRRGRRKSKAGTGVRTAVVSNDHMADDDDGAYDVARPIYTEKGYDPALPPIRERFPFLPEYEEDGSPRIEVIVGRRSVDDKEAAEDSDDGDHSGDEDDESGGRRTLRRRGKSPEPKKGAKKTSPSPKKGKKDAGNQGPVEYEYLVKYKGRSYLHLEWKSGADLESMNKSAKGIYRRYVKKVAQGQDEDLENPEFDPSYVIPEKILDEADQEISVELTDKELLRWEKQREKELAAEDSDSDKDATTEKADQVVEARDESQNNGEAPKDAGEEKKADGPEDDWEDEVDFSKLTLEKLRPIVAREGPYYPVVEGSTNPYRDGYVTEPPKKPRASYLFFQCTMRSYFQKKNPRAVQSELMTMLGNKWQTMSDADRQPFLVLGKEESKQFEKEKAMLAKAQKANEVWQPLRRCMLVVERLAKDSFADIFLEPVNLEDFPDYEDFIDTPMDLGTVRTKLQNRKYQAPEQFARDMRRIWNNCKIYNQHGSAIWHVADYMSKQFERLYHAWVLEFRERYLRWADPRARPWEHTCRKHDGSCKTPDDQMVLCDHCDAMYGIKCLDPPLKKIPTKAWHCRDCKPKLKSAKGVRMLSAVAENAARKRAELGDLPKKKVKQVMFLVKWSGLGYEFCTWETKADVNDDTLIAEFRKLNNSYPDDTDMAADIVHKVIDETKHVSEETAEGKNLLPSLKAQLYAQTRLFQFSKFGVPDVPDAVCSECGPKTQSVSKVPRIDSIFHSGKAEVRAQHPREVSECLSELIYRSSRKEHPNPVRSNTSLPPIMYGEYDAIVPITAKGLMMNVGEINGAVAFLGYRLFEDGSKGPAEKAKLIKNVGDKIIAVDGVSTVGKSFKDVIGMLRESGKNKYAYMRFLESRYSTCESGLASTGEKGRYAIEELQHKFATDRQRMVVARRLQTGDEEEEVADEEEKDDSTAEHDSENESGDEGEFKPDSDDEELADVNGQAPKIDLGPVASTSTAAASLEPKDAERQPDSPNKVESTTPEKTKRRNMVVCREETTRSLGFRLLDVDLGYSSDEGGDEDCAYFLDGVDNTFSRQAHAGPETSGEHKKHGGEQKNSESETVPARSTEFTTLGDHAKLTAAVTLSSRPPDVDDFDNFPHPSKKELEKETKKAEDAKKAESPEKAVKRSTVKVEQVSIANGEVIHVWANIEAASATLQLPLPALRQVLRGEYDEEVGDEVGGFKWRYAIAGAKVTAGLDETSSRGGGGKKAKEAWLEFRDKLYDPNEPHDYKNGNRLRDYQVDGVNWLSSTWYKRQGCVLADEMGLGKTVQIVCYIEHLFRVEKIRRPFLVVVPLSTVEHWRREFEGWTDMVCCIYHDRQRVWRDVLREYEWYYEDRPHTAEYLKFDVLVTTYDTLIGDFDVISQIPFRVAVVDEAHRLRNQKGKLLECMREISAKGTMQYGYQSRVLMSGTPLQNDLTELWTLLNFIAPFTFPDLDVFQASFGNMANREQVENLQKMISPFMLRRVKEDVAKDIPAKEETVIDVELTSIQKQYYRAIFEHNHAFLNIGATRQTAPKLMNIQMELRKVCNHPYLLEGVEYRETDRCFKEFSEKGEFQSKSPEQQQYMLNEQGYVMTSGKMVLLDKLLPKLRQEGHKILIFSQMVKMLDLISDYCDFREFRYERLDGRVRGTERQKAIDRFEREDDSFLFLLSTRAGGVGINLTAADICIIFDSDWNPQNDVQAQARCHRIGQTKDVQIYRLVTSRSFEQEMFDRASKKLGLEQAVLGTFEKETDDDKPTQQEMEQLLKRGAYALLEDDNDEITKEFCADDIESILKKRTRTRVVEGAKTASWLNKQGMVVSKSKFSAEGDAALDMDDPEFWQKVMPDFVTPSIMMQKLDDLQHEILGTVKGPGRGRKRGRGRPKKEAEMPSNDNIEPESENVQDSQPTGSEAEEKSKDADGDVVMPDENSAAESDDEEEEENDKDKKGKAQLTRGQKGKVQKYMNDLNGMMEGIFEEEDEEGITPDEKSIIQKLLLTISVKEKIFNEAQRFLARKFLKRIEGDRRRRCRTTEQRRFNPGQQEEDTSSFIREELRIVSSKKKKKRRKRGEAADEMGTRHRRRARKDTEDDDGLLDEDGYLRHSDSEGDWSDVADDLYSSGPKKRDKISAKEAQRRREWCTGDDELVASGRPWPVFPRHLVSTVLTTVLDEMMKYDDAHGGVFSEPVSRDDFPEYYEQIKNPMDYSTMRKKLENNEYRSAQAMQKDFILILQNCRDFNAKSSEIVAEARQQHLLRPKILKEAAVKHNLFLAEDGSVLEIQEEKKQGTPKKTRRRKSNGEGAKKKRRKKDDMEDDDSNGDSSESEQEDSGKKKKKKPAGKPRIRINVKDTGDEDGTSATKGKKKTPAAGKKKRKKGTEDDEEESGPASKRRKKSVPAKKKRRKAYDPSMFDAAVLKKKREQLDGSFDAALGHLAERGPWKLPKGFEDKFKEIALGIIAKMDRYDRYDVFAEAVSEEEAPGYHEVVKKPMDFGTMKKKINEGDYGEGNAASAALYEDFVLVFNNCALYNPEDSEVSEEAARVLGLLPEAYATVCTAVMKKK